MNQHKSRIKLVLLGDTNVGKTSLVNKLTNDIFVNTIQTIGASFTIYKLDPETVFEIFDTAGQERYAPISHLYYRNAHVILLIFDVNNLESLTRVYKYIQEIKSFDNNYKYILIGSKIDLTHNINKDKISEFITNRNMKLFLSEKELKIIYLSSKTGENIYKLNKRLVELKNSIILDNNNNLSGPVLDLNQDQNQEYNFCSC